MLDYLRIDGIDLHDYVGATSNRDIAKIDGLLGLTAPRGDSKPRAEGHGGTNRSRWLDSKTITLEGELWGDTVLDALGELDVLVEVFNRTLVEGAKLLTWRRAGGGLALQQLVKLAGPMQPPIETDAAVLRYQVMLEADDPRAYADGLPRAAVGDPLSTGGGGLRFNAPPATGGLTFPILFDGSAGGTIIVTNNGRVETPPVFRVYGPVTSPTLRLSTTGQEVKMLGEIAAGQYLELDHYRKTAKLNGATLRMNFIDVPATRFFDIPPGVHELRLIAGNFGAGAHVEAETRDAYGG